MPFKNKDFYLNNNPIGKNKVFNNIKKLNRLIELAKSESYSVPKLVRTFKCGKSAIFRALYSNKIVLPNLGRFKKMYNFNENFFKKLNKTSTYWAGFIAADGYLMIKKEGYKYVILSLSKKDVDHLHKFRKVLKSNIKINYIKQTKSVRMALYSEKLFNSLNKLGITQRKSLTIKSKNTHTVYTSFY